MTYNVFSGTLNLTQSIDAKHFIQVTGVPRQCVDNQTCNNYGMMCKKLYLSISGKERPHSAVRTAHVSAYYCAQLWCKGPANSYTSFVTSADIVNSLLS